MASEPFVPVDFKPPTSLVTDKFRLEPRGPQHNDADHAAWTSSIDHIRGTPGLLARFAMLGVLDSRLSGR